MITSFHKGRWLFRLGMLAAVFCYNTITTQAQCDFINNITGITLSTFPTGDAANPALYTETYVLVDHSGHIYATGSSPDFAGVDAGLYNMYAVNYNNNEMAAVLPLLAVGQPWDAVEAYGDDALNCLDYTTPYGSCKFSVCEQQNVCEFFTLTLTASGFQNAGFTQEYCLVCGGVIQAINTTGTFDMNAYGAATPGSNTCQVMAVNYATGSAPAALAVGGVWSAVETAACNNCIDYIGMSLNLLPISQASGNGVSTPVDWTDGSGCNGAQPDVNNGAPFSTTVNNWCTPDHSAPINARPDEVDDLIRLLGPNSDFDGRVPCTGAMDLTQNPIFYTVQCDALAPSTLTVDVDLINTSGNITRIEAALYGPVDPLCPVITTGTFVDCDDSGAGSLSGDPLSSLQLVTDALPGQVFLVIVDTEGREQFTISSTIVLLNTVLLDFSGKKEEEDNVLEWATAKEENTAHFELERSDAGVYFEKIGTVAAAGHSDQELRYQFHDEQPGEGTRYYRLKLVKQDGSFEYSKIVALSRDITGTTVEVYPNPTRGSFTAEFTLNAETAVEYAVTDMLGREVLRGNSQSMAGVNKMQLDLGGLPTACYLFSMTVDGQRIHKRIIKQ